MSLNHGVFYPHLLSHVFPTTTPLFHLAHLPTPPPSALCNLHSSHSQHLERPPITQPSHPPTIKSPPAMDFTRGIQNFGKNISTGFTPFASRTQQFVREQLGQVEDKVSAPPAPGASDGPSDGLTDVASSSASSDTITPTSAATATAIPDTTPSTPDASSTYAATATATVTATATAVASATTASTRRLAELLNETGLLFMIRRRLTETKTQLPPDYIELEKRVDALRQVHQQLLAVTYVHLRCLAGGCHVLIVFQVSIR